MAPFFYATFIFKLSNPLKIRFLPHFGFSSRLRFLNLSKSITDKENAPKLLVGTGEEKVHLCIVLTADRGLCGGFNTNIIKKAKSYFEKIISENKT